ncbi:MAG: ribulokinase [Clostridia bacterium]|nr:ribulokinase [Clostridia bacterium]
MSRYTVGLDFGTLSARALLADTADGKVLHTVSADYPHGVLDVCLPSGKPLPKGFALQHPGDYLFALYETVPVLIRESGVRPEEIAGIGIDFTSSTLLPLREDGTPLCLLDEFREEIHAWPKLWKHHSTAPYAREIEKVAEARGEAFLGRYGGRVSSEWLLPKVLETLREAPAVYDRAIFAEGMDYMVRILTGELSRSASSLGYKAFWDPRDGFPSADFFRAVDPRLEAFPAEKLGGRILPPGSYAGSLLPGIAGKLGLLPGTPVAAGTLDAHAAGPALGVTRAGQMYAVLGTSGCHMLLGDREKAIPGICGVIKDGIMPGFYGYEAGQSGFGDIFAWFLKNAVPLSLAEEAKAKGVGLHDLLSEKAARLFPGESGLLALDWWNGNRSVLVDPDLSGLLVGMTLQTSPAEIYRALLESVAFGMRMIVETFREYGLPADELIAAGGIAGKNPLLMQILADVLRFPVRIGGADQASALGAAILGASAAGKARGGYDSLADAAAHMGNAGSVVYLPDPERADRYDTLFGAYRTLHDLFGRGGVSTMKLLSSLARSRDEEVSL